MDLPIVRVVVTTKTRELGKRFFWFIIQSWSSLSYCRSKEEGPISIRLVDGPILLLSLFNTLKGIELDLIYHSSIHPSPYTLFDILSTLLLFCTSEKRFFNDDSLQSELDILKKVLTVATSLEEEDETRKQQAIQLQQLLLSSPKEKDNSINFPSDNNNNKRKSDDESTHNDQISMSMDSNADSGTEKKRKSGSITTTTTTNTVSISDDEDDDQGGNEENNCVICLTAKKTVLFMPCR